MQDRQYCFRACAMEKKTFPDVFPQLLRQIPGCCGCCWWRQEESKGLANEEHFSDHEGSTKGWVNTHVDRSKIVLALRNSTKSSVVPKSFLLCEVCPMSCCYFPICSSTVRGQSSVVSVACLKWALGSRRIKSLSVLHLPFCWNKTMWRLIPLAWYDGAHPLVRWHTWASTNTCGSAMGIQN